MSIQNGYARRIATQAINLECSLETPVGSVEALKSLAGEQHGGLAAAPVIRFVSSGAEYTPLDTRCQQYIVVLAFLGAIECILPQIYVDSADLFRGAGV